LILTDREILIALDRGLITINPRPDEEALTAGFQAQSRALPAMAQEAKKPNLTKIKCENRA